MPRYLVIFAKEPRAGLVKTRLVPPLTGEEAAELYRAFLLDLTRRWASLPGVEKVLAYWPPEAGGRLQALVPSAFRLMPQQGLHLAERMARAFESVLRDEGDTMVLTNSDSPDLPEERLEQAFTWLETRKAGVVIGPDTGGGYYLVAQCWTPEPRLFERVVMGNEHVLLATLERCRELGVDVRLLEPYPDVDTPADLQGLAARIREPGSGLREMLPETTAVLERQGWLP
ncbi:MAG: TIGR04282 family arsenosugar biosynthesis glycosyltransferase [Planctomycetota bacterium]